MRQGACGCGWEVGGLHSKYSLRGCADRSDDGGLGKNCGVRWFAERLDESGARLRRVLSPFSFIAVSLRRRRGARMPAVCAWNLIADLARDVTAELRVGKEGG